MTSGRQPSVTVVIPARNEEVHIARTLDAIAVQDYPADRIDVIVVDNGSTDRTAEIARARSATVIERPGVRIAALRNAGAARATSDVLAFLDADCVPARDWIRSAVASVALEEAVTGSRVAPTPDGTWVERAWFLSPPAGRHEVSYINSGNLIVSRRVFEATGGFEASLVTGEDSDFCRRARAHARVISDGSIHVVHLGNPRTLRQFFVREMWHGAGGVEGSAWTLRNKPLLGAIAVMGLTLAQVAGALWWWASGSHWPLTAATLVMVVLLASSAVHRAGWKSPLRVGQLTILYFAYYVARGVALLRRLFRFDATDRMR